MHAAAAGGIAVAVAGGAAAAAIDPDVLQARYDAARERQERAVRAGDGAAARRAHAEVLRAEVNDFRPAGWRGGRDVPVFDPPRIARGERARNERWAAALATVGHSYRGWAGFWVHDLATGAWAGWNADARFPAASTVKLGVLAAALRTHARPERSSLWYDLRQIGGWSSNLATNRVTRIVGDERVVAATLHRLGATSSTYPGPYRAGTAAAAADAPKPPPHGHWRVTTPHDLGRVLYSLHAAAAGNRYVQRRIGLSRRQARLGLAVLSRAWPRGNNAGLVRPYVRGPVVRKEGWLSDTRATAAIVYRRKRPLIVVVLVYRPGVSLREAQALGARVASVVEP